MNLTCSDLVDIQEALNGRIHSALELADECELKDENDKAQRLRARAERLLRVLAKVTNP